MKKQPIEKVIIQKYKGLNYAVWYHQLDGGRSGIAYYCGYVRLPYKHSYRKFCLYKQEISLGLMSFARKRKSFIGYEKMDISVHGGLTFSRRIKNHKWHLPKGNWIGWDYAHAGDDAYVSNLKEVNPAIYEIQQRYKVKEKRWTKEEVEEECRRVIEQVLRIK